MKTRTSSPTPVVAASTFRFDDIPVRVLDHDQKVWFVAQDALDALRLDWQAMQGVAEGNQGRVTVDLTQRTQWVATLDEVGLYELILTAGAPMGQRFQRWLTADVLPAFYRDQYISRLRVKVSQLESLDGDFSATGTHRRVTEPEQEEIKKLNAGGMSISALSRKFRRSRPTIQSVLRGGWGEVFKDYPN